MANIQFYGVSKYYDPDIIAVEDLNFTIHDGEYLSLLGPSGCGKTTTLRMLSGLIKPSKGRIEWDGKPVQDLPPEERNIGYVFQQFAIFPHMTVYDNIAFGPRVKEMDRSEIEDVVDRYVKVVGLGDKLGEYPPNLEAADLQRIGIARVLATGARTLLLDEPMGALDFKIREQFQDELRKLVKELGLTAIHVTHDQSEAMAISDRIGVMKKGRMVQLGSPVDLLYNPSQIFTAHFIGESDFFEGIVIKNEKNRTTVELLGNEKIRVHNVRPKPIVGQRTIVGIRREFFEVQKFDESLVEKPNYFTGEVILDTFLGEKRRTRVKLNYGRSLEVKRKPNEKALQTGEKILVHVPDSGAFLFKYPKEGLDEALSVT